MNWLFPWISIFLIAVLFVGGGEIVLHYVSRYLWNRFYQTEPDIASAMLGKKDGTRLDARFFTSFKGCIERVIYACAILLGTPEAIVAVLALNGISQLKFWSGDYATEPPPDKAGAYAAMGRAAFNIWLSLHLLNVLLGVTSGLIVKAILPS